MEECPGPVLSFCRQPESEQEQLACGSSRGEQQFGSVWFHGWKHLQVRGPFFPSLLCETLHCVICDTHASSQTRLGTPLPSVRPCLCLVGQTLPSVKPCLSVRPSVRSCLLWDPGFCEALPSVRPFLLWDPAFVHNVGPSVRLCFLWDLAFCEALPSARPFLLWELGLSSTCDTLCSVKPGLCFRCETLWSHALCESLLWVSRLAFCETLPSVRPCLLWDPGFCDALPSARGLPSVLPSVRPCLCLMGETLSSVKPCLYVRFCLPWCVRPCHLLLFIWRCLMGGTLPYLALCETLPFEAHSFEDVLTFKKQETTAVLILLWESHVIDLPTGFVRTWALDIANSCWIPSKRTDWEVWATVLANCQILKLSCFYVPCHVVIVFHYLPLFSLISHVFSYF